MAFSSVMIQVQVSGNLYIKIRFQAESPSLPLLH
jgi:hypothetical protein